LEGQENQVPPRPCERFSLSCGRKGFRLLLPCSLLAFLASLNPAGAGEATPLTGWVLDLLGRGIPEVEVLIFPGGKEASPLSVGTLRTDVRGRFRLFDLQQGSYLLALNKPGYQILLAQVNTQIRSRLSLTLIPGQAGDFLQSMTKTGPMDWILRAPRTDALKELRERWVSARAGDPSPLPGEVKGGFGTWAASPLSSFARLPVSGELQQWFTSALPFAAGADSAGSSGRSTTLSVSGDLGERGDWRVGGVSGNLGTQVAQPDAGGPERDQGADSLRLGMRYEMGPEDSLRLQARYDRDRFHEGGLSLLPAASDQEVHTWGYQADWLRRVGKGDGLEMNLGFLQAFGRLPEGGTGFQTLPDSQGGDRLRDRRWNLGAVYGFNALPEHRISLRAHTRVYRYDQRDEGWVLAPVQPTLSPAETGEKGWSLSLSGEDAWKLSDPVSLTLAIDYHRADSLNPVSILVPRIGARREGERSVIQGLILIQIENFSALHSGEIPSFESGSEGENLAGYRMEALRKVGETWTVGGHALRNPLDFESARHGWEAPLRPGVPEVPFLADPTASTREIGLRLLKRFQGMEGGFESDRGTVTGKVASVLDEAPIQILGKGGIRYLALKASASLQKTATQVRIEYRRLRESQADSPRDDSYRTSRAELLVLQEVPVLQRRGLADWRILFSYQALERQLADPRTAGDGPDPERVKRLSGGVGVLF